jgi:hypothetical protein
MSDTADPAPPGTCDLLARFGFRPGPMLPRNAGIILTASAN